MASPATIDKDLPIAISNGLHSDKIFYSEAPENIYGFYDFQGGDTIIFHDHQQANRAVQVPLRPLLDESGRQKRDSNTNRPLQFRPLPNGRDLFDIFKGTDFVEFVGRDWNSDKSTFYEQRISLNPEAVANIEPKYLPVDHPDSGRKLKVIFSLAKEKSEKPKFMTTLLTQSEYEAVSAEIYQAKRRLRQMSHGGGGQWSGGSSKDEKRNWSAGRNPKGSKDSFGVATEEKHHHDDRLTDDTWTGKQTGPRRGWVLE